MKRSDPEKTSGPGYDPQADGNPAGEERADRLVIRIDRHSALTHALARSKRMWHVSVHFALIVVFLFVGLTLAVITIKRIYPYNEFQTNIWGATMIRNEEKEVTYWLFNTAELWANTGIQVREGDLLTVRASGGSHTAVHHLVEAAERNRLPDDPWSGTEGVETKKNARDRLRARQRIIPHKPQDALIMWVAPSCKSEPEAQQIYLIGKERQNFRVAQSGELRFAVNDIVLTPRKIYDMTVDHLAAIARDETDRQAIRAFCEQFWKKELRSCGGQDSVSRNSVGDFFAKLGENEHLSRLYAARLHEGYSFGPYPDSARTNTIGKNEMSYYNESEYADAWYGDNVGSFLIVIERTKE